MTVPANLPASFPFLPESNEQLWFWNISTDALHLSRGALDGLLLSNPVQTMSEFLTHVPASSLPTLYSMREGVLSGEKGSRLEICYLFDDLDVRELMIVLARDADGRAVCAMGHYVVMKLDSSSLPENAHEVCSVGLWQGSVADAMLRLDRHCAILLGCVAPGEEPGARTISWAQFFASTHTDDATLVQRDYDLCTCNPQLGDTLEHDVRVRRPDGSYTLMKLCGSVLERGQNGDVVLFGGTLTDLTAAPGTGNNDLAQQDNRRLLYTVNSTGDGLWDWDATNNSVYYSSSYLSMIGYTAEEFPGWFSVWARRIHPDDHDKIVFPQLAIVESPRYGDTFECTYRLLRKNGTWAWILGRGYVTHRDESGRATRLVGMHTDITTVQDEREKLEELVKNDTLTGLRSRAYCNLEVERLEKNHIRPVSVILADINGLKLINDSLGHAMGDKLLAAAAILLREPLRATDCVARTGGDEFVILLPGCTRSTCETLLDRLRECFDRHNAEDPEVIVYAAFGMASTDPDEAPVARIIREADAAMILDKQENRIQVQAAIKQWVAARTGQEFDFKDCRLIG